MNHSRIGTLEAICLILSVIIIRTVLSLPKSILAITGSASVINLLYVGLIMLLLVYFIYRLFKKFPGMDIIDISEVLGGSVLKKIVGFIFIFYFIVSSSIFLRNFCECLRIVYYPSTSILFVILFFIIALCATNYLSFNASLKANLIITPIALASIIFLFVANFRHFSPQRIFPILGNGIFETFVTGLGNISSFSGIVFLYFLPPLLKEPQKFKKVAITSVVLSVIYLIITVSIVLFIFPYFVQTDEVMPLYSAATYIEFGSFFQRLESVFLLIWILVLACYLGIISKFVLLIFRKITNIKDFKPAILPVGLCILAVSLLPKNYATAKFYETDIYPYLMIGIVCIMSFLVLLLASFRRKRKVGDSVE